MAPAARSDCRPVAVEPIAGGEPCKQPVSSKVHVYLEVSGCIGDLKGALYQAVLNCREFVHPTVHLFSTEVADMSFEKLRRVECRTTDETSIDCVAGHIHENRVRRAVIITDGFVRPAAGQNREVRLRTRLGVALTPWSVFRDDLKEVTDYWAELAPGKGEGNGF